LLYRLPNDPTKLEGSLDLQDTLIQKNVIKLKTNRQPTPLRLAERSRANVIADRLFTGFGHR
jgi:hypothetical protein